MHIRQLSISSFAIIVLCLTCDADILRQTMNQPIPGTDGINAVPGVDLSGADLEFAILWRRNLSRADMSNANLTDASFWRTTLTDADLTNAVISRTNFVAVRDFTSSQLYSTANYRNKNLQKISLGQIDLSGWNFRNQNLSGAEFESSSLVNADLRNADLTGASLQIAELRGANFSGAIIEQTNFHSATGHGLTKEQFYSTASYRSGNLRGIEMWETNLTNWNLAGQDLSAAVFQNAVLRNTNLSGADVKGTVLTNVTSRGFTKEQLYSTASYQSHSLPGIVLSENDLTGWDFSNQNLTDSDFFRSEIAGVDFTGARIRGAKLGMKLTEEQLYSTASYESKDLTDVFFSYNDLSGWDFSNQNLTDAYLARSSLRNANLTNAVVFGADLGVTGITNEQIYSTRSYRSKNLQGVVLNDNDLTGIDLSGQDLAGASLVLATLANANLNGANITGVDFAMTTSHGLTRQQFYSTANYRAKDLHGVSLRRNDLSNWDLHAQDLTAANFSNASLENTDFTGATVAYAKFENTTSRGLTKDQLYSTASYKERDLRGIRIQSNLLRNWDLSEQNLADADFNLSTMTNVNLSDSNLIGAVIAPTFGTNLSGANLKNATLQDANLEASIIDEHTVYNQWTVFPDDYDPIDAGLRFELSPVGDFDAGGSLDSADVDMLSERIRGITRSKSYSAERMLDVNLDRRVDRGDLNFWIKDVRKTWFGDANLDGEFDSGDLVRVFQSFEYEDDIEGNSTWISGDWNADGDFTTGDLIVAFQDGGYESGAFVSVQSVPEPAAVTLLAVALFMVSFVAQRRLV